MKRWREILRRWLRAQRAPQRAPRWWPEAARGLVALANLVVWGFLLALIVAG